MSKTRARCESNKHEARAAPKMQRMRCRGRVGIAKRRVVGAQQMKFQGLKFTKVDVSHKSSISSHNTSGCAQKGKKREAPHATQSTFVCLHFALCVALKPPPNPIAQFFFSLSLSLSLRPSPNTDNNPISILNTHHSPSHTSIHTTMIIILMMTMTPPSQPPLLHHHPLHHWAPSPSPSPSPSPTLGNKSSLSPPSSKSPVDFSPPLIAMVVVVAAAFLVVTYSRLIARHLTPPIHRLLRRCRRRRRRSYLPSSSGDLDSLPYDSPFEAIDGGPHVFSPYGLDESVIKTIPFSLYTAKKDVRFDESRRDCAVCLLEFEDDEYVRTLPVCAHTFHVDCIDAWLRSHANCPLCRAGVLRAESRFTPMMAARIRPSLDDDTILHRINMEPLIEAPAPATHSTVPEITPCIEEQSPRRNNGNSEDRFNNGRDFLLKRSYSFGFERSLASERMVMEPATASPWRYRRGSSSSFWSKRPSPFGSLGKARVFSFRYYRGMKSPFFRRRGFFPLSESSMRYGGGGSSSRRSKSIASPMFLRSSGLGVAAFSSSRLRCGDPEALLSPERFNRR